VSKAPSVPWSVTTAVVLVLVGATGAIKAGAVGADFMYDLENTRPALAVAPPMIAGPPTPPLARRVVLAIVDGLRLDVSYELPFLGELRRAGVDGAATSHYPTYSRPGYVTILTGVPPAASGVRTNQHPGTVSLDSLMDRVRAAGRRTGFASDYDALPRLFMAARGGGAVLDADLDVELDDGTGKEPDDDEIAARNIEAERRGDFDDARYAPWPGGFRDSARSLLAEGDELVVLLIGVVDSAGHAHGGDSDEYRAAAQVADRTLATVLAGVDLEQDAVIVLADHGHTDRGGHGGVEPEVVQVPLVAVGAGIRPGGQLVSARLVDIAPTAAALLGVAAPGHGVGRALTEILAIAPGEAARLGAIDTARAARNLSIVQAADAVAAGDRLEKRAWRLAVVVGGALLAIGLAVWLGSRGGMRLDIRVLSVGVPAFFIVYYTLIGTLGQSFSPSLMPARGHIAGELLKYGAVGTLVHILAGWRALRRRHALAERLAAANGVALCGLFIAMLSAGLVWAYYPPPYVLVPTARMMVLIPAVLVAVSCYTIAVALTQVVEVIVFFARAVDPRVRLVRLERAAARARAQVEGRARRRWPRRRPPEPARESRDVQDG
jgi:hypothetical protein